MHVDEFTKRLNDLSVDSIRALASSMQSHGDSAAGEVAWWHATVEIERTLRVHRATRLAAVAAHNASRAVLAAAERSELRLPDQHVTMVARAAAQVARALVAGDAALTATLFADFEPFLGVEAAVA